MARVYNFSAGPAVLPEEVLREAADEMLDYAVTGMSVMEMSHRSTAFARSSSRPPSRTSASSWAFPTTTTCCSCRVALARSSRRSS